MNENQEINTQSDEEIESLKLRDETFNKLKSALIQEHRLLGRFYEFCEEYDDFEYDEMGMNMEEGADILRKANKIRDKLLLSIELTTMYIFTDIETNTLARMVTFNLDTSETQHKVIVEFLKDSFNLEII